MSTIGERSVCVCGGTIIFRLNRPRTGGQRMPGWAHLAFQDRSETYGHKAAPAPESPEVPASE